MIYLNNFRIRKLSSEDNDFTISLREEKEINSMLGSFLFISKDSQLNWIRSLEDKKDSMYCILEIKENKSWTKIGLIRINHIDFINRSASVGGDIIKDYRGKGFAKEMFELIFKLCFDYLNLHRLWLLVLENNDIAINLYNKLGFINEGKQREAIFRNGKYLDYIMMSILFSEYKKNKNEVDNSNC